MSELLWQLAISISQQQTIATDHRQWINIITILPILNRQRWMCRMTFAEKTSARELSQCRIIKCIKLLIRDCLFGFDIFLCIFVTHSIFMAVVGGWHKWGAAAACECEWLRPRGGQKDIHCNDARRDKRAQGVCLSVDKFEDQSNWIIAWGIVIIFGSGPIEWWPDNCKRPYQTSPPPIPHHNISVTAAVGNLYPSMDIQWTFYRMRYYHPSR